MIKAVLFDLDDTLFPEKQYIESGFKHIARQMSKRTGTGDGVLFRMLMDIFDKGAKNVFNKLLEQLDISYDERDIQRMISEYRNHAPDISFYPDVLPCLDELGRNNIKTGIITDGYLESQRQKLKALNCAEYFNEIIITEELGRAYWKPHPRSFKMMGEKLNVRFDEMMYVGDNPEKDFYVGERLDIFTVRIIREDACHGDKKYYKEVREKKIISNLAELCLDTIQP